MDEFEPLDEVYEEPTGYKVLESYHDLYVSILLLMRILVYCIRK